MGSGTKAFVVTLCGFGALFLFGWTEANAHSASQYQFGRFIGDALFKCAVAGIITGLIASWLKWSWGGIVALFALCLVILYAALTPRVAQAGSVSVDGNWVGQGERIVCGNSTGSVPVSISVSTQATQHGCPDCLKTTDLTLNVNGESSDQQVNVAPDGAMSSGLNNVGINSTGNWYVTMRREGGAFSGFKLIGTIERMNYQCNNLGQTGEKVRVELHRP